MKKFVSVVLMLCFLISTCLVAVSAVDVELAESGAQVEIAEVGKNYGLADNIQDGNILHCFNWKYNDIKAELENIAAAGFTSIQTSPAQGAGTTNNQEWYMMYQPTNFAVSSNSIGTKEELRSLCRAADEYGIKIVVDVVANHLRSRGYTGDGVDSSVARDYHGDYFHGYDNGGIDYDNNRWQITHHDIGMADLNSENPALQNIVYNYTQELKSLGVDGIRWDAAKHIGLPSEGCAFWSRMTESSTGLWNYGEILVGAVDKGHENLMVEYSNLISVTDNVYGNNLTKAILGGGMTDSIGNWSQRGVSSDKIVYWAESHDTYSNNGEYGENSSQWPQDKVDRAYAILAAKNDSSTLYFSRPFSTAKKSILAGQKGSTNFKSAHIAEVNKFHNAMIGKADFYSVNGSVASVTRQGGGAVIVNANGGGQVSVANGGGYAVPGTYKDMVSGNTFTVTSSTISGQIGSSGIAVIYNATPIAPEPEATISQEGGVFNTETLSLTIGLSDATSGTYSINGGAAQTYTGTKIITIGQGVAVGSAITVTLTATDGSKTFKETYTFTKADPNAKGVYFDNSQRNWNTVYCYYYSDTNKPVEWPGKAMTNQGNNLWYIDPGMDNCFVIFSNGEGDQTPGAQEQGYIYNGVPMIYNNNTWQEYYNTKPTTPNTKPTTAPTKPITDPTEATKPTTPTVPSGKVLLGDADLSGKINVRDVSLVQSYSASLTKLSDRAKASANVDGNKVINVKDATAIQKYIASIPVDFPIGNYVDFSATVTTDPTEATVVTKPTTQSTQPTASPDSNTYKIYFVNSDNWSSVNAYYWGANGDGGAWPGSPMTHVSGRVYMIEVPKQFKNIIFNTSNGTNKTGDLNIPDTGHIYDCREGSWSLYSGNPDDYGTGGNNNNNNNGNNVSVKFVDSGNWGYVKAICWKNSSSQQRDEYPMQSVGGNVYEAYIPKGYDKIYFTNGNQWCQDQSFPENGGTFDYYTGWK